MHTRHGLPTVELGEPGEDRRHLTALVLARGAGTLIQAQHTAGAVGAVAVGDRLLLVDHTGRNAAVLEVDNVEQTTTAELSRPGPPAAGADQEVPTLWVAPPPGRSDITAAHRDPRTPVSCIGFHVVGHEGAQALPGQAAAQAPQQKELLLEE